jgi:hypothetical protein
MSKALMWPEGKQFAFTIFDDPDSQTLRQSQIVYSFLKDLGLRTTKGIWPVRPLRAINSDGDTCGNAEYRTHLLDLRAEGFEIAYHLATPHTCNREEVLSSLDTFREIFGHDPKAMANHYNEEAIYWGSARLSGLQRVLYDAITLGRNRNKFFGEHVGSDLFWGDACQKRIRYCRNFVFSGIDTLAACPVMPYYDPDRPYVNAWYASSEGANCRSFVRTIGEANQDDLLNSSGACIMYAHFGHQFVENDRLNASFSRLMKRLSRMNGWFVPVSELLDYLGSRRGDLTISIAQRNCIERRWLLQKLFRGTS